jgi:hypothetical protein
MRTIKTYSHRAPFNNALTMTWSIATRISVCHRQGESGHRLRRVGRERSFRLRKVQIRLFAFQDNSLCEPGSSIGECHESPLEQKCCTVQPQLDCGRVGRSNLSKEPL